MSELKAINAYQLTTNTEDSDVYIHNDEFGCGGDLVECYLKSEADKVIAELEDKLQNVSGLLKETREWLIESQKLHKRCADNAVKVIRHSNYKRCLARAEWCRASAVLEKELDAKPYQDYYERWLSRWLKLAEKFKEAK